MKKFMNKAFIVLAFIICLKSNAQEKIQDCILDMSILEKVEFKRITSCKTFNLDSNYLFITNNKELKKANYTKRNINFRKYNLIELLVTNGGCSVPKVNIELLKNPDTNKNYIIVHVIEYGNCTPAITSFHSLLVLKRDCPNKPELCKNLEKIIYN